MPYSAEGKDSIILIPISQGPREQTMNSICLTTGESKGPEMCGILQVHSSRDLLQGFRSTSRPT